MNIEEKIRLERERERIEKERIVMDKASEVLGHKNAMEEEHLRHKNAMEEWNVYKEILPRITELLKLQKEIGPLALTPLNGKDLKKLGEGLGTGMVKQDQANKEKDFREKFK